MSHATIEFSRPGTPLSERTVGELVTERPGRSRIFQANKIDFCCQGGRTLKEACERKGVDTDVIVAELEREASGKPVPQDNPAELPPSQLCDYIVERHHRYLIDELPRLHAMAARVAQVHGGHTASLVDIYQTFHGMAQELSNHMQKEERILFPTIKAMSNGKSGSGLVDGSIRMMMQEHDEAGAALSRIRELTNDFQPPPEACNTYRALFAGLEELEEDLHRHIHLENAVLFPAARKLAAVA